AVEICAKSGEVLVVTLIGPDDFALINREVGRNHADDLLREFARRIAAAVRREDRVFRHGGATIAVVARVTQTQDARALADKLRESLQDLPRVNDERRITFSIGAIAADGDSDRDPRRLSLCADQALNRARLLGGDRSVFFDGEFDGDDASHKNPLGSIFTADTVKDYRNGRVLWNTISLIAAESDPDRLACLFVELLEESFAGARAALLDFDNGQFSVLGETSGSSELALTRKELALVEQACKANRSQWQHGQTSDGAVLEHFATPLRSRDLTFGGLFLECKFELDASEQVFLRALADQIAGAIDRARLAARWAAEKESESEQLRAELRDLRSGVPANSLIARAAAMQDLLAYAEKIAPSDASVLILGESGTGKEVLARTVHELSDRADKPMVTVDCGAIAHSLIDSELFGRAKGAYTGADAAQEGRITQADGATLFLDEIGELPLDVQAKLLRFVQEKEITPVGSTQRRWIDARIICATNRNLLHEVREGRFREDLYYRLQVIQLAVPPLRQRPEDVFGLVNHFLGQFAAQLNRPVPQLTPAAWEKIESYRWPGNVRELQNAIMRCVLGAEGDRIDAQDLQIGEALDAENAERVEGPRKRSSSSQVRVGAADKNCWDRLQDALARHIEESLAAGTTNAPLGRWLVEDLVLSAGAIANSNSRRSASLLGMAETTFRRQLGKAREATANAYRTRSEEWRAITEVIEQLVAHPEPKRAKGRGVFERCQSMLLEEVSRCVADDVQLGAQLMDISPPTYRRWRQKWGVES
ncbi:MAG: sigma 54-interacting transcriptional regulator, partial [Gammaproteobacteria bacterium]|nr:sigma 54-interacting transcriptional regulator [Gammaproteobacteria bacterium]